MQEYFQEIVVLTLVALAALLTFGSLSPIWIFFGANLVLLLTGIIEVQDILHGFSNEALAILILMLMISEVFKRKRVLYYILPQLVEIKSLKKLLILITSFVGVTSPWLNNTPIVAITLPQVVEWSKAQNISPSKVLIPLSYASILGGCVTLIGTSTNLIANSIAIDLGLPSLQLFDFFMVGSIMLVLGLLYLWLFADLALMPRLDPSKFFTQNKRQYLIESFVTDNSSLIGKTVNEAGLRNLEGTYLVQIIRGGKSIQPVTPNHKILAQDKLIFAGDPKVVSDITNKNWGLSFPDELSFAADAEKVTEVVVSPNSHLVNKRIKDSQFRAKYDAAILAVHRGGSLLKGKIGEVILKPGDVLMILEGSDFSSRIENNPGFYLINSTARPAAAKTWHHWMMIAGFVVSIILPALGWVKLSLSLLIYFAVLLAFERKNIGNIRKAIDYHLILIIVLSLSLGKAIMNVGIGEHFNTWLSFLPLDNTFLMVLILFAVSNVLSSFITSKAALAILMPVCLALVTSGFLEARIYILALAFGSAANFITPFGYQTNLMVYGAGNYKTIDYFKLGLPLTVIYGVVCATILSLC